MRYRTSDRRPAIQFTIKRDGTAVDVSGASSVNARVRPVGSTLTSFQNALTAVTDGSDGQYLLSFTANQLATAGEYEGEIEITWSAGITETAPGLFYISVVTGFADVV